MSSRVLRKVQSERQKGSPENENEPLSDTESDLPIGGARRKQFNVNRYDLVSFLNRVCLGQQAHRFCYSKYGHLLQKKFFACLPMAFRTLNFVNFP